MNQLNYDIQTKIWRNVYEGCFTDMLQKRYEMGLTNEVGYTYSMCNCGDISWDEYRSEINEYYGEHEIPNDISEEEYLNETYRADLLRMNYRPDDESDDEIVLY